MQRCTDILTRPAWMLWSPRAIRHREQPGAECSAPAAAGDPARARQIAALSRESTRLVICSFQVESYVVLYLTRKSNSSHRELCGTQHVTRSGPEPAAPLTPKGRETLRALRQRHRAFPSASLARPRVIPFRN